MEKNFFLAEQNNLDDSIGNPLTYNGWDYTWKWGKRLATASNTAEGISTNYKYNDSGIRTYKQVTTASGVITYNYNLMGDKITYEQRTGTNACDMYYAYDNGGKLYGLYYNGTFYFYKRNIQGDIIGILNTSGTEVVTYKYDTWGKLLSTTGSMAGTLGERNPFRYRGYYYDAETGLYYLNQRYYNPEWGRFINADNYIGSTDELLSHNVFAYCINNPRDIRCSRYSATYKLASENPLTFNPTGKASRIIEDHLLPEINKMSSSKISYVQFQVW